MTRTEHNKDITVEPDEIEQAIGRRRRRLDVQLDVSAVELGLSLTGPPVHTYDLRSAGAPALDHHLPVWLRVVVEDPDYQPACRWDGNVEANAIHGVPKPTVLRWHDRAVHDPDLPGHRLRTEVMTLASAPAVSDDSVLTTDPDLPEHWWTDLEHALAALARHPVSAEDPVNTLGYLTANVRGWFDADLAPTDLPKITWTTAHADLHWANLTAPELTILDWECWRPAPAGYDLATLYCTSLLVPNMAARVRIACDNILDTPNGAVALLLAVCRYLPLTHPDEAYPRLRQDLLALGTSELGKLTGR